MKHSYFFKVLRREMIKRLCDIYLRMLYREYFYNTKFKKIFSVYFPDKILFLLKHFFDQMFHFSGYIYFAAFILNPQLCREL